MKIDGVKISNYLQKILKKEVAQMKKKDIKLVVYLAKNDPDQLSFVKIKSAMAKKIGVKFEFVNFKNTPLFIKFATSLRESSHRKETTGVIIQQPLPSNLATDSIYNYIPDLKEIEGIKKKSPFYPPIGLAVLTIIKYVFEKNKLEPSLFVDVDKDRAFFKKTFKNKRVVLIGRGVTGGKPIGKVLTDVKINYISINSKTPNPETYYQNADLIITAVGKKVIKPSFLKPGSVLINVGLRKESSRLKGDYEESEIKNIVSSYTPTPGGIGPIDVIYLYKNLVDAAKLQLKVE